MAGENAHKVYLIDEVHMLTDQAFNALLKTLEEPPPHIVFILATTDAHRVPATITSRCQRQDFKRIPLSAIVERLEHITREEQIEVPREGLELIARSSTGSLRDAINLLEQICDSYGKEASTEAVRESLGLIADERAGRLAGQALHGDLAAALATISDVRDDGLDLRQFQKEVVGHLRDLLLVQAGAQGDGTLTPEQVEEMRKTVEGVPRDTIVQLLKRLSLADTKQDPLSSLPLELAIAESMAQPPAPERAASAPAPRAAPPRQSPPTRAPEFSNRAAAAPPPQRPAPERVPPDLKRDNITGASAEDIARMVGSAAPVIPAAPLDDVAEDSVPNGAATSDGLDLASFVDQTLRPRMKESDPKLGQKLAALINGSCHAVSLQDDVLTLGFYMDGYQKKTVETEHRKRFEQVAAEILGKPVSIRCIIAPKPAAKLATQSPLVQHAVQNRGAKIVENDS
jgi:DNA polymerase-3 subunit gamma/tau